MSIKQQRMNDRIQHILSQLLQRDIADPRLRDVTITEVQLDPELVVAKVYVSAMGDESREIEVMKGFRRARGFLRRELGKRIRLRHTPELHFDWDHTLAHADRINQLIAGLNIPAQTEADSDAAR
ncbi:MAG: 30S ribosome-binding factor RbfA [Chloroflexi bacterium]|nr:30S ribosome-binding factor RbfA [Chloroflexota bacterium]MCY4248412.1 30S ribosome-binding factor RbfA [Chloroflexota bacterium]